MSGYMLQTADAVAKNPWKFCLICNNKHIFISALEFKSHLRNFHCTKEGGSYVCRYGRNNVCPSLPMEGVDEQDYMNHVERVHITLDGRADNCNTSSESDDSSVASSLTQEPLAVKRVPVFKYKDDYLKETDKTGWICHPCQNLTSVLNDPRTSRRQIDFFTKQWGESFIPQPVTSLPLLGTVPKSYFDDHTKRFEFKQMQHEKLKKLTLQPYANQKYHLLKNKPENTDISSHDGAPEIFFRQNFNLEDPVIFKEVFPWSSIGSKSGQPGNAIGKRKKSSKLLQEKLTHYLDVTEVKLAQQIATKSEDFFGTMRTQEKLEGEVQVSCQNVKQLRLRLKKIRSKLVSDPLEVMQLFRLRHRYETVLEKINLMATVHQTQPTIQLLLKNADFVSALDLIDTSLEVLSQELAGVQCFRHLGSQLSEMAKAIERMMQADFLEYAINILNQPHVNDQQSLYEEDRLLSVVFGLIRQKNLKFLHLYKTECFGVIKNTIKQTAHSALLEDNESSEADHSGKFGDYIRSLAHDEWLVVLESCFCVILQILKNMGVIHEGLVRVFKLATGTKQETILDEKTDDSLFVVNNMNSLLNDSVCEKLTEESKEILGSAFELIQTTCSKVITMRAKGGALDSLSSNEFVDLARAVEQFASDCEAVCGRQSHHLRGTLLSQAKKFVEKFHEERKHKLSNILDIERWSQADVPREIQDMVSSVSMTDGFEKVKMTMQSNHNGDTELKSFLIVQGQRFAVVGTLLMLMRMISEYCQCVVDVPMLVTDLLTKICEILKLFNSRSCQIVLGAGALQTIGLKRISAKHLALVAQCLEVVILHIHIIKNHFEVRLEPKQFILLHQFDQILKDYSNHRHELICKIVSLMEGIFQAHLENYIVRPPMPSKAMREIVKQILKLRESMEDIMSTQQMESFFRDVRRCFKNCFAEKLAQLNVINDGRPQHGMVTTDINHFVSNLKQYQGFKDLTNKFDDLWITVRQNRENISKK